MLEVSHLNAWYDRSHVVQDISFEVRTGEIVTMMGRNGAGKSSLLRIMAGVDTTFSGEAVIAKWATIGYLAQEPDLGAAKTVKDAVEEAVRNGGDLTIIKLKGVDGNITDMKFNVPPVNGHILDGSLPPKQIELFRGYPPVVGISADKPGFILLDKEPERWDVMLRFATGVYMTMDELLHALSGAGRRSVDHAPWNA